MSRPSTRRPPRRRRAAPRVSSARKRFGRRRATGCLLWIVGLIVVLIVLSLMFGGFRMGTKAGGAGVLAPLHFGAVMIGGGP
jgi:hypothetical protein